MRAIGGGRGRGRLLLPVTVLLAGTLAGCSTASERAPAVRSDQSRFEPRTADQTLKFAEELLVKTCMEKRGYQYWVVVDTSQDTSHAFPYVVDDERWAKTHGYGTDLRRRLEREARDDPNQKYLYSVPPDQRPALIGALNGPTPQGLEARLPNGIRVTHSDQGCVAEAERDLYKDLPKWFRATRVTDGLGGMRVEMVTQDKRYKAATASWARCMRGQGQPYEDPFQARAAATTPGHEWPHGREVRLATAEASCANSTDLASVVTSLDKAYKAELRRRYPQETADRARLKREALPRARAIIARQG
ncbi:hypothetical protein ACFYRY_13290 [Streptomyces sp. NPDC005263]|uniref:hypothetical protein n=1 Tax=Streptomyces sp. NPDC005263 TaxID=3364711 RepID=UPI003696B1B1